MSSLTLVTAPAVEPCSTADAKAFCRVDTSTDDGYIASLITAARRAVESYTGRALCTQTWDAQFDEIPGDVIYLPMPPLISVTSIKFTNSDGTEGSAIASTVYTVDVGRAPGRVIRNQGQSWGYTGLRSFLGTKVRFVAGYGATAADVTAVSPVVGSVPSDLVLAVKRIVLHNYENRDDVAVGTIAAKIPNDAILLMDPYRLINL